MQLEVLTKAEMELKFDGEWMLIGDPYNDDSNQLANGTVLAHSKERSEIQRVAMQLLPERAAFFYFGKTPGPIWINFGLLHNE